MPRNSFFINNGRAEHLIESEFIKALNNHLSSGALDVYNQSNKELFSLENILITPHVGSVDLSYWERQKELFEHNLINFLNGKISLMKNICNLP